MNPFRRLVHRLISPQLRYCPRDTEYLAKKQSFEGKCEISGTISQPKKSSADVLVNLVHPPMTTDYRDQNFKGILGDFFGEIIEKCFVEQCQISPKSFKITVFNSTASFVGSMKENNSDIAFPIMRPLKMFLTSDDYNGSRFRFEEFMKTPWYSLILDVKNFNSKANSIVFKTLGESVWPIVIFTLLIAGISGICVWALVRYQLFNK